MWKSRFSIVGQPVLVFGCFGGVFLVRITSYASDLRGAGGVGKMGVENPVIFGGEVGRILGGVFGRFLGWISGVISGVFFRGLL